MGCHCARRFPFLKFVFLGLVLVAVPVRGAVIYVSHASFSGAGGVDTVSPSGAVASFVDGLTLPTALTFDSAGNLYVGVNANGKFGASSVLKITPTGQRSTYASGFTEPTALAFDAQGNLYVANDGTNNVSKVNSVGIISNVSILQFEPEGLAFDSHGNLFVSTLTSQVIKVTPAGAASVFVNLQQGGGAGLAIDSADNLYVSNGSTRVYKVTPAGTFSIFGSGLAQSLAYANGILYGTDTTSQSVIEFDANGRLTTLATGILDPQGIAVQPAAVSVPLPSPLRALLVSCAVIGFVLRGLCTKTTSV